MQSTERAKVPILFNEMGILLIQSCENDWTKEENYRLISLWISIKKIIKSILTADSNNTLREQIIITKWDLFYDDKYSNNRKSLINSIIYWWSQEEKSYDHLQRCKKDI